MVFFNAKERAPEKYGKTRAQSLRRCFMNKPDLLYHEKSSGKEHNTPELL
jgi:hypothetical protein